MMTKANEAYAKMSRPAKVIVFLLTPLIAVAMIVAFIHGALSAIFGPEN